MKLQEVLGGKKLSRDAEYNDYIIMHKANVVKAYEELIKVLPDDYGVDQIELCKEVEFHDMSKYSDEEYPAYRREFYPMTSDTLTDEEQELEYKYAWNHHQKTNPHHWQYWLLMEDDNNGSLMALDMPLVHLCHLVCDWVGMSYDKGGTALEFYENNKEKIVMTDKTREDLLYLLNLVCK